MQVQARVLLDLLLVSVLDDGRYDIRFGGETLVIDKRAINGERLHVACPAIRRHLSARRKAESGYPLADLLVALAGIIWHCNHAEGVLDTCRSLFVSIAEVLACVWEVHQASSASSRGNGLYMHMPLLRGPSGKPRRVSCARKQALVRAVADDPDTKDIGSFAAAQRAIKRSAGEPVDQVSPKTTKRYRGAHLYGYFLAGANSFAKHLHVNLALDGVRVGGVKYLISSFYSVSSGQAMWMPPQANS